MTAPPFPAAALAAARDAAKAHLRIDGAAEDAAIEGQAAAALALAEAFTGRTLILRDHAETLGAGGARWQRLAAAPVAAITRVEGLPADGAAFALPVDAYQLDIDAAQTGWVRIVAPGAAGRVRVHYAAGLTAGWDGLPPAIAQGLVLLIAHLFEARALGAMPPAAIAALWRPWRRLRIGCEVRR